MIAGLLCALGRGLLKLRYRVELDGFAEIAARGRRGILFLPNHPALIDPVILRTHLQPWFAPHMLADRDQVERPVIRSIVRALGGIPMLDPVRHGEISFPDVERALAECAAVLRTGGNLILYPAGRIYRQRYEDLGGNSAVETVLRQAPEARVVLIRTRGLWGSSFSRASGRHPDFLAALKAGFSRLLASGIFFMPRREVRLAAAEQSGLPLQAGRAELNRFLENYYNQDAPPNQYVPYTPREKGGLRTLAEPSLERPAGDPRSVPAEIRTLVEEKLRGMSGLENLRDDQQLARDLGIDSLGRMELQVWMEQTLAIPASNPELLQTVGDAMLAAHGQAANRPVPVKPPPPAWYYQPARPLPLQVPAGDRITEVFLRQAARDPRRPALADQSSGVRTYRDIITAILVLRPHLAKLEGQYLGIMLPASAGGAIVYLATLFAGKIPVMVNWTAGSRNLRHSLDSLGVRQVLTASVLLGRLAALGTDLTGLEDRFLPLEKLGQSISKTSKLLAWIKAHTGWSGLRKIRPPETAVILFTSGSENVPKAVPLTHGNLLTNVRDAVEVFPLGSAERMFGFLPPFHSFGLTATILLPLLAGLRAVYHANPTESALLAELTANYGVTVLAGTPTFVGGIVRAAGVGQLSTVRLTVCGAEKCPAWLYDHIESNWPEMRLLEGYGITECAPVVSVNRPGDACRGTIGRPLPSVVHAIQDLDSGQRTAPGQTGMLLVRGPSIFGGYMNYTGPSPFTEFEGHSWYRTGDLIREDPGGHLVFMGRLKRFVKLGGEMVSLPAVEEALAARFGDPESAEPVLAVEATPLEINPELVLFSTLEITREQANAALREAGLPPIYSIRQVRRLESIPLLGTGKTDYRALKTLLS